MAYKFREDAAELYGPRAAELPPDMKGGYVPKETMHAGRAYRGRVELPLQNVESADDLHNIVCMVAQGLHDRNRTQQTFPQINELFRRDNTMEPNKPLHAVADEKPVEPLEAGAAPMERERPVPLPEDWLAILGAEFRLEYMCALSLFLRERRAAGAVLYPAAGNIFRAFWSTPVECVRVVILGQDPYHNPGQAHGLSFSVPPGAAVPPSLANIYRELNADLAVSAPDHGCLMPWAQQGVLLLNSVLTVEHRQPASHQGRGWERFTDRVVECLSASAEPRVFLLWGSHAQKKGRAVDRARHCVLTAAHPSPLSAHRGFLGCRHFSQANAFLEAHGRGPIDWQLPPRSALG